VAVDINNNKNSSGVKTTLGATWNDWANLVYHGGGVIGKGISPELLMQLSPVYTMTMDETTLDQYLEVEAEMLEGLGS
jgi:hypothetical protein